MAFGKAERWKVRRVRGTTTSITDMLAAQTEAGLLPCVHWHREGGMAHVGWRLAGAVSLLCGVNSFPAFAQRSIRFEMPAMPLVLETITDRRAAEMLVDRGLLVKSWFYPRELGGPDDPENVAYITTSAAKDRAALIRKLKRLLEQDVIDQLDVQADYKGKSIIPSRLRYTATHSRGGKSIEAVQEVW